MGKHLTHSVYTNFVVIENLCLLYEFTNLYENTSYDRAGRAQMDRTNDLSALFGVLNPSHQLKDENDKIYHVFIERYTHDHTASVRR